MDKNGLRKLNRHPELIFKANCTVCAVSYEARILASLSIASINVSLAGRGIASGSKIS